MKKLFIAHVGVYPKPQGYYPARMCGYHQDKQGIVWTCFTPTVNNLGAWVRLEAPGKRTRFVCDAGYGFRHNLLKSKPKGNQTP